MYGCPVKPGMTGIKMTTEPRDVPKVMMLPPTLLLLHIAAGIVLNWAVPMSFGHAWGWLGLVLLGAAFGITKWSRDVFKKAGTNVPPNQPAITIVKDGPYQYSRNPMYVCFLLIFTALALLADAPMMMLLIFPLFYFLDQRIIVPEEEYLLAKFGDAYRDYQRQVRRWI
jgi:protein-S-isoprenylcysteine O-methyltransferase Ste14